MKRHEKTESRWEREKEISGGITRSRMVPPSQTGMKIEEIEKV